MKFWIMLFIAGLASSAAAAQQASQPDRQFEQTMNVDMIVSPEELVTVERVDLNAMTIQVDGHIYRLPGEGSSPVSDQIGMSLRDLRAGAEVFIQTDGTEPSADHRPFIVRIWK